MRPVEYAHALFIVPLPGNGGVARTAEATGYFLRDYFLKSLSKASRASLALRGGGVLIPCGILPPGICVEEASRATVTRGENNAQSFC